jgi:ankyrin repeat protein
MPEPLTIEEGKLLLGLCRAGKLYEIERWIASGKPLRTPREVKKTPLQVAIDLGFHSLIELLVRNESLQEEKDKALNEAVSKRRLDLVQLLVDNGAHVKSVPLADVLQTWEPSMIRFFLESGADVITGSPFAIAFGDKIRTALRPFVDYKAAHPEVAPELQAQADRALRHFAYEADMKWISLMIWAGANPRKRGPTLDDRFANEPECHTTALDEACHKGNLEVLKKLKIDPRQDDLAELLHSAALSTSREVIHYLLQLGANPNNKPNGGSSALDRCLWHLGFGRFDPFGNKRLVSKYEAKDTLECIQVLVERGARWCPDERREMISLRQTLCKCEPAVTVELVKLFARYKASTEETLEQLLDAPRMREHLSQLGMKLALKPGDKRRPVPNRSPA